MRFARPWHETTVAGIAARAPNAIVGGPFGSNLVSKDYTDDGVPVIRGRNMGTGRWVGGIFAYVSAAKAEALRANIARPGDIVFTQRGTLGQVALVPTQPFKQYVVSQSQMKLTPDAVLADPLYLYYAFSSPEQQSYIHRNATQTGVPHTNLAHLRSTPLGLPPLSDQQAIAHVLGTLDDKIELNRRMNETLEEMARAIFKSWFVDFDPVKAKMDGRKPYGMDDETAALFPDSFEDSETGRIPTGWLVQRVTDVAETVDCLHSRKPEQLPAGRPLLQVFNLGTAGDLNMSDPYYVSEEDYRTWIRRIEVQPGDLIITKTGRVGAVCQIPEGFRAAIGRNIVAIRGNPDVVQPAYLRDLMLSNHMRREIASGTSQGTILESLHVKSVGRLRLALPPLPVVEAYEQVARPLHRRMETNIAENATLAGVRDALLPKLISGELDVRELTDLPNEAP
jgi:type I restriction enzyme, S subunit